jgi:Cu2+-exporting ATPase
VIAACFHCGEPLPRADARRSPLLGAERDFCCPGCEAVAHAIVTGGFERYYETREQPGARPAPVLAAEACDEDAAQAQFASVEPDGTRSASLVLEGIRCAACLWLVERALRAVPGVRAADLNYTTRRAQVAWDPAKCRLSQLIAAVRAVGYDAWPFDPVRQDAQARGERRAALWRLFVAGFGAMQVMMYAFPAYIDEGAGTLSAESEALMRWASLVLTTPVLLFSCGPFFTGAWRELRRLRPGMDTPIAIGIAAAFAASAWATLRGTGAVYFDSLSMLVFLLLGARYVELVARQRAARSLDRLMRWSPATALRLVDGAAAPVPAHALVAGDLVRVPPGERLPADGMVEQGSSSVDESLLTGEPLPLAKSPGAAVSAGSVNLEQPLDIRVSRAGAATRAAAIARLVERSAASRPRLVAAADALAALMTPAVLAVAIGAGLYWSDPWVAIAVLVAACPCALALASPVALASAAGQLLERGVALTRASALEAFARATDVVLDKTGTLTEARFAVTRTIPLDGSLAQQCLALARALESGSAHPLARAFASAGADAGPALLERRNHPGRGVEATLDARRLRLGTEAFCAELAKAPCPAPWPAARQTPVFMADESGWKAAFFLEDSMRPESGALVTGLQAAGLRVHLLSGDHPAAVRAVADQLAIVDCTGGASPEDKAEYVARLQREHRVVVMVGDGLNDAPVLARADVAIAMGAGADAALLQADLVLPGGRLRELEPARQLARRTMRIVRQNFAWAVGYNLIALPLAAGGWIGPWEAAIGMAASSFIVVLNALRLAEGTEGKSWKASSSSSPSPSPSYS